MNITIMQWLDIQAAALFHAQPKMPPNDQVIRWEDQPEAIKNVWRRRFLKERGQ